MTIAQHLKRRLLTAWIVLASALIGMATYWFAFTDINRPTYPLFFLFTGISFAAALYLQWFIRCPRCHGNLGISLGQQILIGSPKPKYCPFCGASLDENA